VTDAPLMVEWTGEAFEPLARHRKQCDAQYVVGERYIVAIEQPRNVGFERAYFASLREIWKSLPDDQALRFPSVEHMRKFALIHAGFCDSRTLVCRTRAEADRIAAFVRPHNGYAIVSVTRNVITEWVARSQSRRAMGREEFRRSADAVMDFCAGLIGVQPKDVPNEEAA
jgi:hypothetical protein